MSSPPQDFADQNQRRESNRHGDRKPAPARGLGRFDTNTGEVYDM
jgi:hypothetical protein